MWYCMTMIFYWNIQTDANMKHSLVCTITVSSCECRNSWDASRVKRRHHSHSICLSSSCSYWLSRGPSNVVGCYWYATDRNGRSPSPWLRIDREKAAQTTKDVPRLNDRAGGGRRNMWCRTTDDRRHVRVPTDDLRRRHSASAAALLIHTW